jgi:hypothetical protein
MKISTLIKTLEGCMAENGDLDVTMHTDYPEVIRFDKLYIGIDNYDDEEPKLDIRSFPY